MRSGWINLNKPRGISSAKAVWKLKKILQQSGVKINKIGHAGTLDPEATGVLPIAINQATRLIDNIIDAKKEYLFKAKFGIRTSSGDVDGAVIGTTNRIPDKIDCENIVYKFIGVIKQTPNKFSAIKINGKRAYELARANIEFTIPERTIEIYDLKCIDFDKEEGIATYLVICSKGSYIRSLAEDIAFSLQSLCFVIELIRTRVGIFSINDSIDYDSLEDAQNNQILCNKFLKIDFVLDDIPVLNVKEEEALRIKCGQTLVCNKIKKGKVRVYHNDTLISIGIVSDEIFKSLKIFNNIN